LYAISGSGIDMELVGDYKTWVVSASTEREAWFIVFSLGTEFFKDIMANWPERNRVIVELTLAEEVLDFEDSSCWAISEVIGHR
jgi:hypothetical protein